MEEVEVWGLRLRTVLMLIFLIVALFLLGMYATEKKPQEEYVIEGVMAFWPPDMVPHPPHFPPPKPDHPSFV